MKFHHFWRLTGKIFLAAPEKFTMVPFPGKNLSDTHDNSVR